MFSVYIDTGALNSTLTTMKSRDHSCNPRPGFKAAYLQEVTAELLLTVLQYLKSRSLLKEKEAFFSIQYLGHRSRHLKSSFHAVIFVVWCHQMSSVEEGNHYLNQTGMMSNLTN